MLSSSRRPSASRRTFCAVRPSSQKPDSWVSASSSVTRAALASRSKMPRGRPDPFGQVADGGRFHLAPNLQILEQDGSQLDEPQGRLAPGDDGVHARTVPVVRADPAVAVTVQSGRIAARPAVSLTGNEIDERCFLGLLHGLPLSAWGTGERSLGGICRGLGRPRTAGFGTVYGAKPVSPRGKSGRRPTRFLAWPRSAGLGFAAGQEVIGQGAELVERRVDSAAEIALDRARPGR